MDMVILHNTPILPYESSKTKNASNYTTRHFTQTYLYLLRLHMDLLSKLWQSMLSLQNEVVGVVRVVYTWNGIQNGTAQRRWVCLQENWLQDLECLDIAHTCSWRGTKCNELDEHFTFKRLHSFEQIFVFVYIQQAHWQLPNGLISGRNSPLLKNPNFRLFLLRWSCILHSSFWVRPMSPITNVFFFPLN
jgi:hypothetical protein